ncbi:hypothetical protein HMPREF1985_01114 [Mitsuokella sp. oral taxon 131 str. W9106]|nr:hypothetical protein HMPREF1985_01114 [Mitsuokella sp. oral taxon 131 str. W9106]
MRSLLSILFRWWDLENFFLFSFVLAYSIALQKVPFLCYTHNK